MIAILIVSLLGYTYFLKTQLQREIIDTLEETTEQSIKTINAEVESRFTLMSEIAADIRLDTDEDLAAAAASLREKNEKYNFKRMGIALPGDKALMSDGSIIDMSARDYIKEAFEGKTVVSNILTDETDTSGIVSYAAPIVTDGDIRGVLFAVVDPVRFRRFMAVDSFNASGYAYIIRSNGDGVVDSEHPTSFNLTNIFANIISASGRNVKCASVMRDDLDNGRSGCIIFRNKVDKYLYYAPVGINDWYLAHVVPKSVLTAQVSDILEKTYILCAVIMAMLILVALYWMDYTRRRNAQMNKILYTDSVTGGRSHKKFLLDAAESLLSNDRPAAILSLDLNNFKLVNEIFGRETGDVLLWFVHESMSKVLPRGSLYARGMADRFYALVYYGSKEQLIDSVETLCEYIVKKKPERFQNFILKPSVGIYLVKNKKITFRKCLTQPRSPKIRLSMSMTGTTPFTAIRTATSF
jgi:diguanylate cyclase (GGDEF)-like protein